jgi:hypothetical protein
MFRSGVQFMVTGMVDPSVVRIYHELGAQPLDLVREARGFVLRGCGDAAAQSPAACKNSLANRQPMPLLPPS